MTSSFRICIPDVPPRALVWSSNKTFDENFPFDNTFYGMRHDYGQLSSTQTSFAVTYDLGTGNSRTVDHFIMGGVKILRANGVTQATLEGSNNGSSWTTQLGTAAGFQTRTLDGPDDDDLIFTPGYNDQYAATLAAYRYFRVTIAGGSAHKFPVSKIYFGSTFDMGLEPSTYDLEVVDDRSSDTWVYPRGQVIMSKAYYPRHKFTVEWDGVTDAKAAEFFTSVLSNPYRNSVYLHAATYADPLYDNKLVFCRVVDDECESTKQGEDWNNIKAVFEEAD